MRRSNEVLVSAVASAVALAVMATAFTPDQLLAFGAAAWLAPLVYGMAGLLVGTILDRLPGVYLPLFGSMVDLFLFQNPLAVVPPGHFPMDAATAAGFAGTVDLQAFGFGLVVLALLTVAGTLAFSRQFRRG